MKRLVYVFAAALMLGACAQRTSSPLPQLASPSVGHSASACAAGAGWPFNGPCTTFTFTGKGVTAKIPANKGYAVSHVIPPNTFSGSIRLTLGSAVLSQIGKNGAGAAFPAYKGAGTAFLYVVGISPRRTPEFYFDGPVKWVVTTTTSFPGTTCTVSLLHARQWYDTGFSAKPARKQLVISIASYDSFIEQGKSYLAFACK